MNLNSCDNLKFWNTSGSLKVFNNPNTVISNLNFLDKDVRILDIGCGQGRSLLELKKAGYINLHGIDYSKTMISTARMNLGNIPTIELKIASATSTKYQDNQFDVILLYAVLNCIPTPKEEISIVREALRLLRPGGFLCVNDFLLGQNRQQYNIKEDEFGEYGTFQIESSCYMRHTTAERINNIISDCDVFFEKEEVEDSINGNPVNIYSGIFKKTNL